MPNVLFLTPCYYPEPVGSAPVVTDMCEWLASNKWSVSVATLRPSYPENIVYEAYRDGMNDEQVINQVTISRHYSPPPVGGGIFRRLRFEGLAFFQILRIALARHNRQSSHIVSICPSILAVFAGWIASGRRRRHIAVVHDIQSGLARSLGFSKLAVIPYLVQLTEKFVLNRADQLVVLTEEMAKSLEEIGVTRPMTVLPPHIDEALVFPLERPENEIPVLLYSGNLGRKQGLEQLVGMAKSLEEKKFPVRIIIRGDGNHAEELRRSVKDSGVQNVVFENFVPREKLNESMSEADIHLVPQLPQGADFAIPSKVFSIMSSGRPFICTAHEESPMGNLMKNSNAFVLTPPGDSEAFAQKIINLLEDTVMLKEMGQNGRSYVVENLSRNHVMAAFEAVLTG